MEAASYWASVAAFAIVIVDWVVFALIFLTRKKPPQTKDAVKAPRSWVGIVLQGLSYAIVWSLHRSPAFSPFVGDSDVNLFFQIIAVLLSVSSVYLTMRSIRELGKQWSLEARLVEGHDLVMTGPYNLVRHPIYTAMLAGLIATGIVISHWLILSLSIVVFLIGTYIRTRFEERLLADAFGEKFREWKTRVPGLIPFLKF